MNGLAFIDVAPDPASVGIVLAVVIFVIATVVFIAAGLIIFLWYRKRKMRHREMIR